MASLSNAGRLAERACALGQTIGEQADSDWLVSVPWGFHKLLTYVHRRYGAPEIWVTENGCDAPGEDDVPFPDVLEDTFRVQFFQVDVPAWTQCELTVNNIHVVAVG